MVVLSDPSKSVGLHTHRPGKRKGASEVNSESTLLHSEIARRTEAFRASGKNTRRVFGDLAKAVRFQLLRPIRLESASLLAPARNSRTRGLQQAGATESSCTVCRRNHTRCGARHHDEANAGSR